MDIARDLETWFKGRPLWLQDAARKLLDSGALDEKAYDILFKICAAQVGIEIEKGDTPKPQCVSAADFSKVAHIQKVELSTISNVVGINALNPRVPLKKGNNNGFSHHG